jgi:hypothetical protein
MELDLLQASADRCLGETAILNVTGKELSYSAYSRNALSPDSGHSL